MERVNANGRMVPHMLYPYADIRSARPHTLIMQRQLILLHMISSWVYVHVTLFGKTGLNETCVKMYFQRMHMHLNAVNCIQQRLSIIRNAFATFPMITEMPTSGDLKSEETLFWTTPPRMSTHPRPQMVSADKLWDGSLALGIIWSLREVHTIKIRFLHCNGEIIFVSDKIRAKMSQKAYTE